ncbi:hypothetical protein [Marinobacter salsuginis]|uniref:hypothetical protein n=1 Tax=Marinobacter salsuginis TaxID=418719 RepID=UPI00273DB271|nr:hypothetical protein [Marinobacter salsuginis]
MKNVCFAITASLFILSGCSGAPTMKRPYPPPLNLAGVTEKSLSEAFQEEMSYRGSNAEKRRIGLALSGGGTKAGLFAHGILHGLNETGLIHHIDVVSATSGGNYPVYWYFSKHMEARKASFDVTQIFDDCVPAWYGNPDYNDIFAYANVNQAVKLAEKEGQLVCYDNNTDHFLPDSQSKDPLRWQAHLARWPDVFNTTITEVKGDPQSAPQSNTFWLSLRLLGEVPFSFLPMESGVPVAYTQGIERTWGLNPKPRIPEKLNDEDISEQDKWVYTNSDQTRWFHYYHVDQKSQDWESLRKLYKDDPTLPLWVMNTMQGEKSEHPDMNNLYEITPFSYGSPRHGYHKVSPPLESVSQGVRASAAFFDEQGTTGISHTVMTFIDGLIPAFVWGVDIEQPAPPSKDEKVRLSDGGGADNLGLMSLLRRGLDQIIVVDAAEDVDGSMDGLCWAREALKTEKYTLEMDALKDLDLVCDGEKAYNVSEWMNPVIKGEIRPNKGVQTGAIKSVKLFWIKAAWNEYAVKAAANAVDPRPKNPKRPGETASEYKKRLVDIVSNTDHLGTCGNETGMVDCWMPVFYSHNAGEDINGIECLINRKDNDPCFIDFPQLKTVNTTYNSSTYIFWAFRELGQSASRQIYLNSQGELTTDLIQCYQDAKDKRPKRRPNDWDGANWDADECKVVVRSTDVEH